MLRPRLRHPNIPTRRMPQIIFLTMLLGIVARTQPVALQVSGPIESVRILLGGRQVASMSEPPWRTAVDFGTDLTPRELTAVGFDANGREIARTTQFVNLPRPTAEFQI